MARNQIPRPPTFNFIIVDHVRKEKWYMNRHLDALDKFESMLTTGAHAVNEFCAMSCDGRISLVAVSQKPLTQEQITIMNGIHSPNEDLKSNLSFDILLSHHPYFIDDIEQYLGQLSALKDYKDKPTTLSCKFKLKASQ